MRKISGIILLMLMLFASTAFAEVYTADYVTDGENTVYVTGQENFHPIEYYNSQTGKYEGVMPAVLADISEKTGIDFTYLRRDGKSQSELVKNEKVELVSAYIAGRKADFAVDEVKVFSYVSGEQKINICLAFTEYADEALVSMISKAVQNISEAEINGILLTESRHYSDEVSELSTMIFAICVFVVLLVAMFFFNAVNAKKQIKLNRVTDAQTGIGNLLHFERNFEKMTAEASVKERYIAYIILNSNYLMLYHNENAFNDVVKYTANILESYMKPNEFAARITENGFAIAFDASDDKAAQNRIMEMIRKLNVYTETEEKSDKPVFYVSAYKMDKEEHSCEFILFNLRRNCNKILGTDTQIVFCDSHKMNSAVEEKELLESIINGFENNEFKLYLQFIVDNHTKKIISAEALSRWENPKQGLVMPGKYIGVLENEGMISHLDYYMFEMVCRQLHKWKETEYENITISCNFTRITLSENDFMEKIKEISSKYVFEKSKLIIEITEDTIEQDRDNARNNVLACREMGFRIALDDMGSGYTSLRNLCDYPIQIVKIDRDILLKTNEEHGRDLFAGIIALAHSLNLKVVCEGVENEALDSFVTATECDYVQGWYYSKACPAKDCETFLCEYAPK